MGSSFRRHHHGILQHEILFPSNMGFSNMGINKRVSMFLSSLFAVSLVPCSGVFRPEEHSETHAVAGRGQLRPGEAFIVTGPVLETPSSTPAPGDATRTGPTPATRQRDRVAGVEEGISDAEDSSMHEPADLTQNDFNADILSGDLISFPPAESANFYCPAEEDSPVNNVDGGVLEAGESALTVESALTGESSRRSVDGGVSVDRGVLEARAPRRILEALSDTDSDSSEDLLTAEQAEEEGLLGRQVARSFLEVDDLLDLEDFAGETTNEERPAATPVTGARAAFSQQQDEQQEPSRQQQEQRRPDSPRTSVLLGLNAETLTSEGAGTPRARPWEFLQSLFRSSEPRVPSFDPLGKAGPIAISRLAETVRSADSALLARDRASTHELVSSPRVMQLQLDGERPPGDFTEGNCSICLCPLFDEEERTGEDGDPPRRAPIIDLCCPSIVGTLSEPHVFHLHCLHGWLLEKTKARARNTLFFSSETTAEALQEALCSCPRCRDEISYEKRLELVMRAERTSFEESPNIEEPPTEARGGVSSRFAKTLEREVLWDHLILRAKEAMGKSQPGRAVELLLESMRFAEGPKRSRVVFDAILEAADAAMRAGQYETALGAYEKAWGELRSDPPPTVREGGAPIEHRPPLGGTRLGATGPGVFDSGRFLSETSSSSTSTSSTPRRPSGDQGTKEDRRARSSSSASTATPGGDPHISISAFGSPELTPGTLSDREDPFLALSPGAGPVGPPPIPHLVLPEAYPYRRRSDQVRSVRIGRTVARSSAASTATPGGDPLVDVVDALSACDSISGSPELAPVIFGILALHDDAPTVATLSDMMEDPSQVGHLADF